MHRRVDLPSGGYLLFDYAEAFTIIDVNTGRFVGKSRLEDTILANNLEAAREVVRQLRLRDIGGMIVIDFIDMAPQKNRDAVIACLQEELKKDRSKVYLTSISPLGLVEMTRQNVTDGVREIMTATCPTCHGEGRVLSKETIAIENLRTLRRHAVAVDARGVPGRARPGDRGADGRPGRLAAGGARADDRQALLAGRRRRGADRALQRHARGQRGRDHGRGDRRCAWATSSSSSSPSRTCSRPPMRSRSSTAASGSWSPAAAPTCGERHRLRIDHVDRHEAIAALLDAQPVTEEEMLALIDRRTDIHEPERRIGERVDLEDRSRRRQRAPAGGGRRRSRPRAATPPARRGATTTTADAPSTSRRRRRRRGGGTGIAAADTGTADGTVELDEDELELGEEAVAAAATGDPPATGAKKRRRGRRGGRRHRKPGAAAAADGAVTENGADTDGAVADDAVAGGAVAEAAAPTTDGAAPNGDAPDGGAEAAPAAHEGRDRGRGRDRRRGGRGGRRRGARRGRRPRRRSAAAGRRPRSRRRRRRPRRRPTCHRRRRSRSSTIPGQKPKRKRGIIKRLISADDEV